MVYVHQNLVCAELSKELTSASTSWLETVAGVPEADELTSSTLCYVVYHELLSTRQVLFLAKRRLDHHSMSSFARNGKNSAGLFATRTSLETAKGASGWSKGKTQNNALAGQNLESHSSQELGVEGWDGRRTQSLAW